MPPASTKVHSSRPCPPPAWRHCRARWRSRRAPVRSPRDALFPRGAGDRHGRRSRTGRRGHRGHDRAKATDRAVGRFLRPARGRPPRSSCAPAWPARSCRPISRKAPSSRPATSFSGSIRPPTPRRSTRRTPSSRPRRRAWCSPRAELDRGAQLVGNAVVTRRDYDQRDNAHREAIANVKAAEATLQTAKLNLDYTEVRAPVDGRVGRIRHHRRQSGRRWHRLPGADVTGLGQSDLRLVRCR